MTYYQLVPTLISIPLVVVLHHLWFKKSQGYSNAKKYLWLALFNLLWSLICFFLSYYLIIAPEVAEMERTGQYTMAGGIMSVAFMILFGIVNPILGVAYFGIRSWMASKKP